MYKKSDSGVSFCSVLCMTLYDRSGIGVSLGRNHHAPDGVVVKFEKMSAYFTELYELFLGNVDYLTMENVRHDPRD